MFNRENMRRDKVHIVFKQKRMINVNKMLWVILVNTIISFLFGIMGSVF
ncbi:hypothetical protein SFB5_030G0, partial [Candidatus Arthromitus sp. SFB-5]